MSEGFELGDSDKIVEGIADLLGMPPLILSGGGRASTRLPDGRMVRISVAHVWGVEVDGECCASIDIRPVDEKNTRWLRVRAVKDPEVLEALAGRIPTRTRVDEDERIIRITTDLS